MVRYSDTDDQVAQPEQGDLRDAGNADQCDTTFDDIVDVKPVRRPRNQAPLPDVTRHQFKDFLIADQERASSCGTLPFTLVLSVCFFLVAWFHGNVVSLHRLKKSIHSAVDEIEVMHPLAESGIFQKITIGSLTSTAEVWSWIAKGLVPAMSGNPDRPGYVRTFNKVIGKVELRQERLSIGKCNVEDALAQYYRADCRTPGISADPYGPAPGEALVYGSASFAPQLSSPSFSAPPAGFGIPDNSTNPCECTVGEYCTFAGGMCSYNSLQHCNSTLCVPCDTSPVPNCSNNALPFAANQNCQARCLSAGANSGAPTPAPTPLPTTAVSTAERDPAFVAGGGMAGLSFVNQRRYFGFLDVIRPDVGAKRAETLAASDWTDDATSVLQAHVALFNPEIKAFTHISLRFVLDSGGLVEKEVEVTPLSANIYPSTWHVIVDILWLLLVAGFFFTTLQEVSDRKGRCCRRCCGDFWLFIDWLAIWSGIALIVFFILFIQGLGLLELQLGQLGEDGASVIPDNPNMTAAARASYDDLAAITDREFEGRLANIVESLEVALLIKSYHRVCMFWYVVLILIRFFKGFAGQPRIAMIGRTMSAAGSDIAHLAIILIVLFFNFALGGLVLFGVELKRFSTINMAVRSTMAVIFGRGEFAAMYHLAPVSASIWLFCLIVSVLFLGANMLIALIVDHYSEVVSGPGKQASQSIVEQFWVMGGDWLWKTSYTYRIIHRFIYRRSSPAMQRFMHVFEEEPKRVSQVPYDTLLEVFGDKPKNDAGSSTGSPPPWAPVHADILRMCGCDEETAERLIVKCRLITGGRLPDDFPADRLYHEFENSMEGSYVQLDAIGKELHAWLNERMVDCGNLEPRQEKLESLSKGIQPSETLQAIADLGDDSPAMLHDMQATIPYNPPDRSGGASEVSSQQG